MNLTQKNYALARVREIQSDKIIDLRNKLTKEGKLISDTEKLELIKTGKVKVHKDFVDINRYSYKLNEIFDFSKYEWKESIDEAAFTKEKSKIDKEASKIKDIIMLGDEKKALLVLSLIFLSSCGNQPVSGYNCYGLIDKDQEKKEGVVYKIETGKKALTWSLEV